MSPLAIDFGQGNQLEKSGKSQGKVREIRILKLVATLFVHRNIVKIGRKIFKLFKKWIWK